MPIIKLSDRSIGRIIVNRTHKLVAQSLDGSQRIYSDGKRLGVFVKMERDCMIFWESRRGFFTQNITACKSNSGHPITAW